MNEQTVSFSGHRPERLPTGNGLENLKHRLGKEIDKAISEGCKTFLFGASRGFDLMCAHEVLHRRRILRQDDPFPIRLIAVVPFEGQANKWVIADQELYYDTLAQCDEVVTLSTRYGKGCYHERNRWLIEHSSRLICFHDGGKGGTAYTVAQAKEAGMPVINLFEPAP